MLAQVVLAAFLVLTADYRTFSFLSLVLSTLGVLLGGWAILVMKPRRVSMHPRPREDARLVTVGPYAWIRHPMYGGLALLTLGCALSPALPWRLVVWMALCLVLDRKARIEEQLLVERFAQYRPYQSRTARFFPFVY